MTTQKQTLNQQNTQTKNKTLTTQSYRQIHTEKGRHKDYMYEIDNDSESSRAIYSKLMPNYARIICMGA